MILIIITILIIILQIPWHLSPADVASAHPEGGLLCGSCCRAQCLRKSSKVWWSRMTYSPSPSAWESSGSSPSSSKGSLRQSLYGSVESRPINLQRWENPQLLSDFTGGHGHDDNFDDHDNHDVGDDESDDDQDDDHDDDHDDDQDLFQRDFLCTPPPLPHARPQPLHHPRPQEYKGF